MMAGADTRPMARQRWVFAMTVAFLYTATVLRSLLVLGGSRRELVVLLLLVWLALLLSEPAVSRLWRSYFTLNVVLQSAIVAVLLTMSPSSDFFAILLAIPSMQAMQRWGERRAAALVGIFAVLIGVALASEHTPGQAVAFAALYTAANVFLAAYALAVKRAAEARSTNEALVVDLREANRHLGDYTQRLERLAGARERRRLARDLHDSVTQALFSMTLTAQSGLLLLSRESQRVSVQLDQFDDLARSALVEMSVVSAELPPQPTSEGGLLEALGRHLATRRPQDGLVVSLEVEGDKPLPPGDDAVLLRIVQEALNNIVKHASVSAAVVRLRLRRPFRVEIEDHGRGFDTAQADGRGVGLTSMRERAAEIGWHLSVSSAPGEGTSVVAEEKRDEEGRCADGD